MENVVENGKILSLQENASPFNVKKTNKSPFDIEGIDVPNLTSEDILQAIRESRERPTVFDL